MKLNEFLVQVFGSNRSKDDFEQLRAWKKEGELNGNQIQQMMKLNAQASALQEYKQFDVDAALTSTLTQLDMPVSKPSYGGTLKIVAAVLGLLAIGYLLYSSLGSTSSTDVKTFIAESAIATETMSDGSQLKLNAGASLTFDDKSNVMQLNGEAYFDIAKQATPLTIKTAAGKITVVGTSFNVNTTDAGTEIYMFEGTIVYESQSGQQYSLTQNEGLTENAQGITTFQTDRSYVYNYWQNGVLVYKNTSLTNVLSDLERLYNKDFSEYETKAKGLLITANFTNNTLDEILAELAVITGIKF